MKIFYHFLLLTFLLFSACGSSSQLSQQMPAENVPLMPLSAQLSKVSKNLTGTLFIYSTSDSSLLFKEAVIINDSGVSSPAFTLERNTEYRFVLIFYWKKVAIAYVDTTQTTNNDDSTTILFTAEMINYANPDSADISSSESNLLSADISAGIIPNLDPDDDTFPTLIEFEAGTDPTSSDEQPARPDLGDFSYSLNGSILTITVPITDRLAITNTELTFGKDDYLKALSSSLSDDGNGKHTYTATLDPYFAPIGTQLSFTLKVTNSVGLDGTAKNSDFVVTSADTNPTTIDFESAITGEILGGKVTLSFRAYDNDGVQAITVTKPDGLTDTSKAADRFIADWDTTSALNGTYNFRVTAVDDLGNVSTKVFPFTIRNDTDKTGPQITLAIYQNDDLTGGEINYKNGEVISGVVTLKAFADDSVVSILYLAHEKELDVNDALGDPRQSLTNISIRTLDTTKFNDGPFSLQFVAIDGHNNTRTTTFSLTIGNTPSIQSVTDAVTLSEGNSAIFTWDADNITSYTITDSHGGTVVQGDVSDGKGSVTVENITSSDTYTLTLTHTTNNGTFETTSDITVNVDDDRDGVNNEVDAFPTDPTETVDTDGDGVGDHGDAFPTDPTEAVDVDGDGVGANVDCDDLHAAAYPGGTEIFDGLDNDCDGTVDVFNLGLADKKFVGEGVGNESGSFSGDVVAGAGDVDGDGYDDFIVGAHADDGSGPPGSGAVYLVYGRAGGFLTSSSLYTNAQTRFVGEQLADNAGKSVAGAGDVNGDGYDDILIGAYRNDAGGTDAGEAYLIYGRAGGIPSMNLKDADVKFIGEAAGDFAGVSVSKAGDVNGDGLDDFLIGADSNDAGGSDVGAVYLIYGRSSFGSSSINLSTANAKFIGEHSGDRVGSSVVSAGDVDGDGKDDFLIGDPLRDGATHFGTIYLIHGKTSFGSSPINLSTADAKFVGEGFDNFAGQSIAGVKDLNGDGLGEILIGARGYNNNTGIAYLIYGKTSFGTDPINLSNADVKFVGETPNDYAGIAVSSAGDVNGDGKEDILIGASGYDAGIIDDYGQPVDRIGAAYLIYGRASFASSSINLSTADAKFIGEATYTERLGWSLCDAGYAVSKAGDVNGDGKADILIGSPLYSSDPDREGMGGTYLILNHFE